MLPIINENSVTVFSSGVPVTVRKDHVNFRQIVRACKEKRHEDAEKLATVEATVKSAANINESSAVQIVDGQVLYKGTPIHNVLTDKLLSMIRQGDQDAAPWGLYIENVMANPSRNSVDQLCNFLGYSELPIDEQGFVYGYKGVQEDYWSQHGNTQTRVICGKVNEQGQIFNGIGEIIEIERNCVVDDPKMDCAEGIHIGSYDYACNWSERTVLVRFNPRDAVSVPHADCQKLRVCRYEVVADVERLGGDIKRSSVSSSAPMACDSVPYSDEDLKEVLESYVEEFDDGEITRELLVNDGEIPYNSDVTDGRIQALLPEIRKEFGLEDDFDDDEFDDDEADEPNGLDEIDNRIHAYVEKKECATIRQIQSSLSGFANLSSDDICRRCENLNLDVARLGTVSQYVVCI